MSTHNIVFYEDLTKIIFELSSNTHLISSAVLTFFLLYVIILQIEDGEIFATINQRDGMVRFHDNPEKYNSARMLVKLDDEVGHVIIHKTKKCLVLRKPVFGVSNQVWHKPGCAVTENA